MPGLFIDVEVDASLTKDTEAKGTEAKNAEIAAKLAEVCPVGIFEARDGGVKIVEKELDECVLCDLCLEVAPGKVRIIKLYEQD